MKASKTIVVGRLLKLYKRVFVSTNPPPDIFPKFQSISRRNFINDVSMAGAGLLIPGMLRDITGENPVEAQKKTVAIIGGGIAGLNACRLLSGQSDKFNVTLFEGSKRTGGRIYTAKGLLGENLTTELGGEFVDSSHTDMLELIDEFKLEKYDCQEDTETHQFSDHTYFFGGKIRTDDEIMVELKKIIPTLQSDKERIKDEEEVEKLDKLSLAQYLKGLNIEKWFHDLIYWAFTAEFGLDAAELSCVNFIDMVGIDTAEQFEIFGDSDERFKIKGGNQSLTDAMTKKLSKHIKYSHRLTGISKSGSGLNLKFENGKVSYADYVLLAIPFSVLQYVTIDKSIRWPESKRKMIAGLSYGTNSKLLLGFNERTWRSHKSSGYIMNEEIQNGWDNSQLQNDNKGVAGFTVFLGGKQGAALNPKTVVLNNYVNKLEIIFPGTKANYNGKMNVFNWSTNPFARGSYACYKTGQWTAFDTEEMMKPVGNIFFAGEHCSEKHQGFMNGGAETGRRAAEAIVMAVEKRTKNQPLSKTEAGLKFY
jgi:monoamine oxidase